MGGTAFPARMQVGVSGGNKDSAAVMIIQVTEDEAQVAGTGVWAANIFIARDEVQVVRKKRWGLQQRSKDGVHTKTERFRLQKLEVSSKDRVYSNEWEVRL